MFEIRANLGILRGRKCLIAEREKFFELISQGASFSEAVRIVGPFNLFATSATVIA